MLKAQKIAKEKGYSDVLYLDAVHKRYLEEVSSCNIFLVKVGQYNFFMLPHSLELRQFIYHFGLMFIYFFLVGKCDLNARNKRNYPAGNYKEKYYGCRSRPRISGTFCAIYT